MKTVALDFGGLLSSFYWQTNEDNGVVFGELLSRF
jgi:hypothetical protein